MASGLSPERPGFSLPVGTVTFLLTDVEGSTRRWESAQESMGAAVARHDELLDAAIVAHNGVRPVETVKTHLTHVYDKLGVRNRTALAAALGARDLSANPDRGAG